MLSLIIEQLNSYQFGESLTDEDYHKLFDLLEYGHFFVMRLMQMIIQIFRLFQRMLMKSTSH